MTTSELAAPVSPRVRKVLAGVAAALAAVIVGLAVGSAVSDGLWFVVAGAIAAPFGLAAAHRRPELVFAAWFLFDPLLMFVDGGGPYRKVYWVVHRLMPVAVLAVLFGIRIIGERRLPKLGLPEFLAAGYLIVSLISIAYASPTALATTYFLYDRVAIPMVMYLLVRLVAPTGEMLARLAPFLTFFLVTQAAFGLLSWVAPGVLPDAWLNRAGSRTTGSLGHPNVYGTSLLAAGALVLHIQMNKTTSRHAARLGVLAMAAAVTSAFLTLSRAAWLAALVLLVGVGLTYRRAAKRMLVVLTVAVAAFSISPFAAPVFERFEDRAASQDSALSRLPVVVASVRMFQERPVTGFGFGNFDYFDLQYQSTLGRLYVPSKDHASHNLYLTILAEQGGTGLLLYLAPAIVWLVRSRRAWSLLPRRGLESRALLTVLWSILATHVVVNNLSNMRIPFGLSIWWMALGLIGVVVTRALRPEDVDRPDLEGDMADVATAAGFVEGDPPGSHR